MTETGEDVRIDADGMTIEGETLRMIESLAEMLSVTPTEALRVAISEARACRRESV
jgi:hypothetical protein